MESKRKFAIRVYEQDVFCGYIQKLSKLKVGYYFYPTKRIKCAKTWALKKSVENRIEVLRNQKTFPYNYLKKEWTFDFEEITDIKILRQLKMKKLSNAQKTKRI